MDFMIENLFEKIDALIRDVNNHKKEPAFSDKVNERNNWYFQTIEREENNLLRVFAKLIAYSENAPSDKVNSILRAGIFEKIFHNFDLNQVTSMDAGQTIVKNWEEIKPIRFKHKIDRIIKCAKLLKNEIGDASIEVIYHRFHVPIELSNEADILLFWREFESMKQKFEQLGMPYFSKTTTLLHLLLYLGFPCIKPDIIVMKVAAKLGLVESIKDPNKYSDKEKRRTVQIIQEYCVSRKIKPSIIDLYFLIYGGQKISSKYVDEYFIPLSEIG